MDEVKDTEFAAPGNILARGKNGKVYECQAVEKHTTGFKLIQLKSINFENSIISEKDLYKLIEKVESNNGLAFFTIEICGDIYSHIPLGFDEENGSLVIGDLNKYGIYVSIGIDELNFAIVKNPKKYAKDLNNSYYIRLYIEDIKTKSSSDWRQIDNGNSYSSPLLRNALEKFDVKYNYEDGVLIEVDDIRNGLAKEPYIEETYQERELIGISLHGYTFIRPYMFADSTNLALTSLPKEITAIGDHAFSGCSKLSISEIPNAVDEIGSEAFGRCMGLTSVKFKGTPSSISDTAFNGCVKLTSIKVPWAEGAVANAPWGATNATITYNYTGK